MTGLSWTCCDCCDSRADVALYGPWWLCWLCRGGRCADCVSEGRVAL